MLSMIKKKRYLTEVLNNNPMVVEVYSDKDFDITKEGGTFIILAKQKLNGVKWLHDLQAAFELNINFYVVFSPYSALLQNYRIIWKAGKWYI